MLPPQSESRHSLLTKQTMGIKRIIGLSGSAELCCEVCCPQVNVSILSRDVLFGRAEYTEGG